MFESARLKLTAWYLLIIMLISLLFSGVLYRVVIEEVDRSLRIQQFRLYRIEENPQIFQPIPLPPHPIDPQVMEEAKTRVILILVYINIGILVVSGGIGYFLAGRTLKPIKEMVDDHNRFITDASHELRTPLTVLKSEIEVYLRAKEHSIGDANSLIKSNLEEVNNLQTLSESLLNLAQNQNNHGKNKFENISLKEILAEVENKLIVVAKQKKIALTTKVSAEKVLGDKQSLIQLFTILLDNAIKYSEENTKITITSEKTDSTLLIYITDQGIGIAKLDIPHIFDRFYRADISRSKQTVSGYGLGLSIAKKILDIHKGTIQVKSELGKGTTFVIQLPISA